MDVAVRPAGSSELDLPELFPLPVRCLYTKLEVIEVGFLVTCYAR